MMCMTTKKKFEADDPEGVVLRNGRFAYKCECPWKGKEEKTLTAFKFCSAENYQSYRDGNENSVDERTPFADKTNFQEGTEK